MAPRSMAEFFKKMADRPKPKDEVEVEIVPPDDAEDMRPPDPSMIADLRLAMDDLLMGIDEKDSSRMALAFHAAYSVCCAHGGDDY